MAYNRGERDGAPMRRRGGRRRRKVCVFCDVYMKKMWV